MRLGEVSLAVLEDGEVVLTNFVDLHDPVSFLKFYALGEWWLSYAEGGEERVLRFGRRDVAWAADLPPGDSRKGVK